MTWGWGSERQGQNLKESLPSTGGRGREGAEKWQGRKELHMAAVIKDIQDLERRDSCGGLRETLESPLEDPGYEQRGSRALT